MVRQPDKLLRGGKNILSIEKAPKRVNLDSAKTKQISDNLFYRQKIAFCGESTRGSGQRERGFVYHVYKKEKMVAATR